MAVIACLGLVSAAVQARSGPFMPPDGCYLGAYIELDPAVKGNPVEFEKLTGKRHATYLRYVGYGEPFPFEWVRNLQTIGAVPQIAWEPNAGLDIVQDDEYLRGWAEACKRAGCPILLRYAAEMNGTWQAYSGNPDEYVEKWQLVHRVMSQVAANVIMVWCPFAVPRRTIAMYYPGDEFVDWVGVNIYAVVHNDGDLAKPSTEDEIEQLRYVYDLYGDRKPIAICEYAATHYCRAASRKTTQFAIEKMRKMYETVRREFPNVVLLSWFSVDAVSSRLADNEYAVTSDPAVLQTYRELIADDYWLTELVPGRPIRIAQVPEEAEPIEPIHPPETTVPLALASLAAPRDSEVAIVVIGAPPHALQGKVEIRALVGPQLEADSAAFYIDGKFRAITNVQPFACRMTAEYYDAGEHIIKVELMTKFGTIIVEKEATVVIAAPSQPRPQEE